MDDDCGNIDPAPGRDRDGILNGIVAVRGCFPLGQSGRGGKQEEHAKNGSPTTFWVSLARGQGLSILYPGPWTTRPGNAPVCSPSLKTWVPLTNTWIMPSAY